MPVRSDMRGESEMRRYGSVNSLSLTQDLRLSAASGDSLYSDDRQDSMYRSSPDLSMVSLAHTRSSSTDSADGNYCNHSRQSSGSTDCSTRLSTGGLRRPSTTTTSTTDPLQFVKIKSAEYLALQAKKQMKIAQEVNKMRNSVDSGSVLSSNEPDWQSNFKVWRERRKSASLVCDLKNFGEEELEEKKLSKTFSQILSSPDKRRNLVHLYPTEDDDSDLGGSVKARDTSLIKSQSKNTEAPPLRSWKTALEVAHWARDSSGEDYSQSDSETNHSHQSGDTDSVFSDKSMPSKILSDDDLWVKNKQIVATSNNPSPLAQTGKFLRENGKLWEDNGNESHKRDKTGMKLGISQDRNKIMDIKQALEQNDKVAHEQQTVQRRQESRLKSDSSLLRRSQNLSESSSPRFSTPNNKELASPTGPKALLPKEQRYLQSSPAGLSQPMNNSNKTSKEILIKIIQKPNNTKGFGFILIGGAEKKQPVTVQRVALGSAADVSGVQANDEILAVKARDVSTLTLAQVQGIVEHSVKQGTIELTVRRYNTSNVVENIDGFNSAPSLTSNGDDKNRNHSKSNNFSSTLKPEIQISARADSTGKLKLMDQPIDEKERKTERPNRAQSPVINEHIIVNATFNSQALPSKKMSDKPQGDIDLQQPLDNNSDLSAPAAVTLTEERQMLLVKKTAAIEKEPSPVQMQHNRTPTNLDTLPSPIPPKAEPPLLAQSPDSSSASEDSSFGPPPALLRWQRPRPKSEYHNTSAEQIGKSNRNSIMMPLPSENAMSFEKGDGSGMLDKMSKDFEANISVSGVAENKSKTFHFNDTTYIEEWQKKQDQQRMQEIPSFQPVSMHREERLTPQPASPTQIEAQYVHENNVPSYNATPELSPQEKFERDQKLIRQQYEEEKKRAQEAEKQKQDKEKQVLNSDKFMRDMESQIIQTKKEEVDHNLASFQPNVTAGAEPRYNSEPMTIQLFSIGPGRPLTFDAKSQRETAPRNQGDTTASMLKEVSFPVDYGKSQSAPPLRILSQQPELSQELLAREREKIKQEMKQKFEEEHKQWREEQEQKLKQEQEKIHQERAKLQMDQERIQQERALLEQKKLNDFQSNNLHVYSNLRSVGSTNSSLSPRSPPPTCVPKYQENKTAPSTAPKPSKARLTREDLLAMNRKPTPLTNRPENVEDNNSHEMLSPTVREPPSKGELHSLNAVPKQKFRNSAAWIKEEDMQNAQFEKPFVIGKRSDVIHKDNATDHWVVQEAERRRLADQTENGINRNENVNSITAHAGPTIPSQSALVSRFRGDIEPPPRSHNRYSFPSSNIVDSRISSTTTRPLSASSSSLHKFEQNTESEVNQFNARTQPSNYVGNTAMSQTLPPNLSFSANSKNFDSSFKRPRSLKADQEPMIAVSGKQKCSHCAEELGFGAAMVIDSLGLYYHVQCFRCCVCHTPLGNGSEGTDVRVRVNKLHCKNCYSNDEGIINEY